jgi:hypothetical protein
MRKFPEEAEKKITYVFPFPPSADFKDKFFHDGFLSHGFRIEYWDVSSLFDYDMPNIDDRSEIAWKKIETRKNLRKELLADKNKFSIYVVQITKNLQSFPLYSELSRADKKMIFFGRGYLPTIQGKGKGLGYYLNKIFHSANAWDLVVSKLFLIANQYLQLIKKYEITFVAGRFGRAFHVQDSLKICGINHFDVDLAARSVGERPSDLPDHYMVFLDENLPFHPDLINKSITNTNLVDPEKYYESLNKFFSKIETTFNKKIVIAAHPTAGRRANHYDGRPIYFLRTNELVRHADLVLAHGSTAISFAVIHKKILRLITSDEIIRVNPYYVCDLMDRTAKLLKVPIWNADDYILSNQSDSISLNDYENYYREFLSDVEQPESSEGIVLKQIQKLLSGDD